MHMVPSVPTAVTGPAGTPAAEAPQCPRPHLSLPYGLTMDCTLRLDTQLGTSSATERGPESYAEALTLTDHEPGPAPFPGYSRLYP